jgi:hypothetical protein
MIAIPRMFFEKHASDLGLYPLKFQNFWHDIVSNFKILSFQATNFSQNL